MVCSCLYCSFPPLLLPSSAPSLLCSFPPLLLPPSLLPPSLSSSSRPPPPPLPSALTSSSLLCPSLLQPLPPLLLFPYTHLFRPSPIFPIQQHQQNRTTAAKNSLAADEQSIKGSRPFRPAFFYSSKLDPRSSCFRGGQSSSAPLVRIHALAQVA